MTANPESAHARRRFSKRPILFAALALGLAFAAAPAAAQDTLRIAAIVNDEIISAYDVEARIKLILMNSNLRDTPEFRDRLRDQALRQLIDDKLKLQEAKRRGITVNKRDFDIAIDAIEKSNKMPPGRLMQIIRSRDIDASAFRGDLEARIAWEKLVIAQTRATVKISPDAVDEAIQAIEDAKGKPEYLVAEIYLPFGEGTSANDAEELARRLVRQIREGAGFQAVAQTFSQSASAASGGDLGWIRADQLDSRLAAVLANMKPGDLSDVVAATDGVYILLLRDERVGVGLGDADEVMTIEQIFLPVAAGDSADAIESQTAIARSVSESAESCNDLATLGKQLGSDLSGRLNGITLAGLPAAFRSVVADLPIEQASPPIRIEGGIIVLMVCARENKAEDEKFRRQVTEKLARQHSQMISRRLLRDLRRSAFVDIRQ